VRLDALANRGGNAVSSTYDCRPAAHAYADLNHGVVALSPLSKIPYPGTRGVHDATTDHGAIERFPPSSNLAIACGPIVCIDKDPRHDGHIALDRLQREHGALGRCPLQITGRGDGGDHHVLLAPPGGLSTCDLAPGLELLSYGRYFLVWPSLHPETRRPYAWDPALSIFTVAPPPAPEWLVRLAGPARRVDYGPATGPAAKSFLGVAFNAAGLLGRELPNGKAIAECPWASDHGVHDGERRGAGDDSSTAILPPTEKTPLGAFRCRHSSCERRRTRDALAVMPDNAVRAAMEAHPDLFALARRIVLLDRRPS
jgi:hypothetical protein